MRRSLINSSIDWAIELLRKSGIRLPDFAYFTPDQWKEDKMEWNTIKKTMMGWDVTDFCGNDFNNTGAVLFTVRNGNFYDKSIGTPYAEKYIMLRPGQALPMHMHKTKTEDIINRSGGSFIIRLFGAQEDGSIDYTGDVQVICDGVEQTVKAGTELEITHGNSITLKPYLYHSFWAKESGEDIVIGEVSSVNDDRSDNFFVEETGRFSDIEEDEPRKYVLCNEYPKKD
jgi:D-lyxose ketol-isomerase